jgi:carbon-monoxide dehydrogenase medium subunit
MRESTIFVHRLCWKPVSAYARLGGQRRALAGGTDLLVQVKQERLQLQAVVSLRDLHELAFIRHKSDQGLALGAMTHLREIETSREVLEQYPAVAEAASWIGSSQVRTRATRWYVQRRASADIAPSLMPEHHI